MRGRELRDPRRGGGGRDSDAEAEDEPSPEEHGAVLRRRDNGRADKDDAAPYGHSGAATEVVARGACEGCSCELANDVDEEDYRVGLEARERRRTRCGCGRTDPRARASLLVMEEVEVLLHGIDASHERTIKACEEGEVKEIAVAK